MANTSSDVVVVNEFVVIQTKVSEESTAVHYLFIKEHNVQDTHTCKPNGRTLIVFNIPPYVTEAPLRRIFSECGTVRQIFLQQKPSSGPPPLDANATDSLFRAPPKTPGYQVAYIVFKEKGAIGHAKAMPYSKIHYLSSADQPLVTGVRKWREAYISSAPPQPDRLKAEVEKYMSEYDTKVEQEKTEAKETEGVPDEEGWVTVTKQSKNKAVVRTEVQERRLKRKLKKRNREKELLHFYKFQIRESKKEHITQLRQKFEEDKRQIALMKAARKFRPY